MFRASGVVKNLCIELVLHNSALLKRASSEAVTANGPFYFTFVPFKDTYLTTRLAGKQKNLIKAQYLLRP